MNSMSWFLYAIDLINNVSVAATIIFICTAIAMGLYAVACAVEHDGLTDNYKRIFPKAAGLFGIAMAVAVILPSKSTMYAIAASEVGERVVKSDAVQGIAGDATKALHQWIKKQIEPDAKK